MKKFDRLPPEQRKEEIQKAALKLFYEKGFSATTMENIVAEVSLSKGGVYRIYPSANAVLSDLMIEGMRLRNRFYEEKTEEAVRRGEKITLPFLVGMIFDSLLIYPEFSKVYVEFLWEKQRNPKLEETYESICRTAFSETEELIRRCAADKILLSNNSVLSHLTELMNAAVLSLHVLNLHDSFAENREKLCHVMLYLIESDFQLEK